MIKKTLKKKFVKMQSFITIIFLCMFIIGPLNNDEILNNSGEKITYNSLENIPTMQDYTTNSSGNSGWVETTVHQAYNNKSIFEINETSSSFTVPAPSSPDFSSSYINITMSDLSVNNHSSTIDESWERDYNVGPSNPCVTSFTVPQNCNLINASFFTTKNDASDGTMSILLYNSTWDGSDNKPYSNYVEYQDIGEITVDNVFGEDEVDIFSNIFLDNSKTDNNTWYIGLIDDVIPGQDSLWGYDYDDSNGDNIDYSDSYVYNGSAWDLYKWGGLTTVDFMTKIGLGINSTNINGTDINLRLNSTQFTDDSITSGSGYWDSTQRFQGTNNELNFSISADWYNFEFNITDIQVNYTKTYIANTTYTVESGSDTYWKSEANFTAFDTRLNNNTLNFTVPSSWTVNKLENVSSTIVVDNTFLNGSSKIITVYDSKATDGNWTLYCTSTNLLSDVKIGVGGKETPIAYSNETLEFNATFSKPITGDVNLSVYNNSINGELVFSKLSSVTDVSFVTLNNWLISDNLTTYGDHKVQVTWENETDSAIFDSIITIAGETTYIVQNVNETEVLNNASPFNITVEYFDEFDLENVTGATIGYNLSLGGDIWQSQVQNNADEIYNITINPADYSSNGLISIPITINKTNYMNYTFNYNFYIVTNTKLAEITENCSLNVIKGHNATYYLNYTEIDDTTINGANITEILLNSSIEWSFDDLTGGNYSINLNTSQLDVGEYLCNFSIAQNDFKTQNFNFTINVTLAQTHISVINYTNIISRASGLNATIYIHINDTSNSLPLIGVPNSALTVYNGSNPSTPWVLGWGMVEISEGDYEVNISLNGLDYGYKNVILNISYAPNYNYDILPVQFYIRGNSTEIQNVELTDHTLQEISPDNFSLYQHNPQLQIAFDFVDTEGVVTTLNYIDSPFSYYVYIDGLSVSHSIEWELISENNIGTINLLGLSSGLHNFTIITGFYNYENATYSFNLTINDATTEAVIESIQQNSISAINTNGNFSVYESHNLEISILFNDTINDHRISGASTALLHFNGNDYSSYSEDNGTYNWEIDYSDLIIGSYNITVEFSLDTYEDIFLPLFNISVIPELIISFAYDLPESIEEGEFVYLTFTITYQNGTSEVPLASNQIRLSTNNTEFNPVTNITDSTGKVILGFQVPTGNYEVLLFIIEYDGSQVGIAENSIEFSIPVTKPIILPSWAIWAIGILIFAVGSVVLVQKKIIAPKKQRFTDLIRSSASIFDDAINLQHIMIIYKKTGTSIFFKSFADEMLDPDLISGFLTAVQSFGRELKTQKSLNEISYGDKFLLFSDGEFIRVTLVLGKSASPFMKRNLAKFIGKFEAHYQLTLQMWKGQLNIFQDAPDLIDEILHTSVILPHEITTNSKLEKNLQQSLCKQILSIGRGLVSEDRKFLFLAQLLADSIEQIKKDSAEIILSINDLLECKVLTPIKIEKLEEIELSDQEIRTLTERVSVVPNKTDQEKQDLLKELLTLSAAEREVVLSSLMQSIATTDKSDVITPVKKFENLNEAKKEIKNLDKLAKRALKEQEFDECIKLYEVAENISYQWNMDSSAKKYGNVVLTTTVEKYRTSIKKSQKQGKKFEKIKDFNSAISEYGKLLDSAHNLFKLGFLDVEVLIKEFTRRVAEIKKQTHQVPLAEDFLTKDHLLRQQKKLVSKWKKVHKSQDMVVRNELSTKLLLISNFLFKFGQVSESANIKKYHNDLDEIQKTVKESNEIYMQETATRISELKLKKQQFLEYAKEAEEKENFIEALVVYQQTLNTYCQVGDAENAIRLSLKIEELFRKIPNLEKIINDYKAEATKLRANGDHDNALINDQYAETLEDALFISRD